MSCPYVQLCPIIRLHLQSLLFAAYYIIDFSVSQRDERNMKAQKRVSRQKNGHESKTGTLDTEADK
jgi:hypothetical protein